MRNLTLTEALPGHNPASQIDYNTDMVATFGYPSVSGSRLRSTLRLTIEDLKGKKIGDSCIDLEITGESGSRSR